MFGNSLKLAAAAATLMLVGGCTQEAQVTRAGVFREIGMPKALTQLSREFMRETPYMVHFAFDSYALDDAAKEQLAIQAAWIKAHPQVRFSVYGHTDLMGDVDYNRALGAARAHVVVEYLVGLGVPQGQLEVTASFGEGVPVVNVIAPEVLNRRATTYVAGLFAEEDEFAERGSKASSRRSGGTTGTVSEDDDGGEDEAVDESDDGDDEAVDESDDGEDEAVDETDDGEDEAVDEDDGEDDDDTPVIEEPGDDSEKPGCTKNCDRPEGPKDPKDDKDDKDDKKEHSDAGRGNGDDDGDPGKSEGKNNGGDE